MKKKLRLLIVDDNVSERKRFAARLNGTGLSAAVAVSPPTDMDAEKLLALRPDAILIDYQLNEQGDAATRVAYRGPTLAAAVREQTESIPLVLLTRPAILNLTALHASPSLISTAFDEIMVKDDLQSNAENACHELDRLSLGFKKLAGVKARTWDSIVRLLKASKEQSEFLRRADPPAGILSEAPWNVSAPTDPIKRRWIVSDVAQWIRHVVLKYPGILYSPLHAATRLGLTLESFERDDVQAFFRPAKYKGVFSPAEGRWWAGELILEGRRFLARQRMRDVALGDFSEAWKKARKGTLQRAKCNSSGASSADAVCYVLNEPVLREQSLPYRPDSRPACMEEARVSFKAIRETDRYDERLFPPDARGLLRGIEVSA